MLPDDRHAFFGFVQGRDPVTVTLRDTSSAKIQAVADLVVGDSSTLSLWNRRILPRLEREWISKSEQGPYYRIDALRMPVLEFTSSFHAKWEGKPALGQGRLYGNFNPDLRKPPEFEQWYEALVRWIRKNFHRSPANLGGYVGPTAYEFYQQGGYLLPNFLPPRTKEWLAVIGRQHSKRQAP